MSGNFLENVVDLHLAELSEDSALALSILIAMDTDSAPVEWREPFTSNSFCRSELLSQCPASFWRRLSKRFPDLRTVIASKCAAIGCEEDLLDVEEPNLIRVQLSARISIDLREGSYSSGGVGRHVYAAAIALGTILVQGQTVCNGCSPQCDGRRVLELGCGLGLVGLAAAKCGAANVLLTDSAESSIHCAAANAALNGFAHRVTSRFLDWSHFDTFSNGQAACEAAGLGASETDGSAWWPDLILAADVCYSHEMGAVFIETLSHLLSRSPPHCRAYVLNGWPNRGLARFETLCGARQLLAAKEDDSLKSGHCTLTNRPFLDDQSDATSLDVDLPGVARFAPRGLEALDLLGTERFTGFADHPHHLYVFANKPDGKANTNRNPS